MLPKKTGGSPVARGRKKSWRESLADLLEMPREIVLNLPRLTLIGNLQCYVENHRGVIEYTGETVRIAVSGGELIVRGSGLTIRYFGNEEIAVDGEIAGLDYEF